MNEEELVQGKTRKEVRFKKVLTDFSARFTEILLRQNIKQSELARYLGYVPGQINHWKDGRQMPKADDLVGISEFVGKPVDHLLGLTQPDEPISNPNFPTLAKYLWSIEKTERVETSAKVIWDATPDFYWAYDEPYWREIVFKNITERKVKCYFLYKQSEENDKKVRNLAHRLQAKIGDSSQSLAHYVPVAPDEFPGWAEHILYDPDGNEPQCIMVLGMDYVFFGKPDADVPNLEFTPSMTEAFAKWFKLQWNKRVTDPNWAIP